MTTLAAFAPTLGTKAPTVPVLTYLLTLGSNVKNAHSLAYAKALAPQMFARLGTQVLFQTITITEQPADGGRVGGKTIAIFNRKGWHDVTVEARPAKPATTYEAFKVTPMVGEGRANGVLLQFPLNGGVPATDGIPTITSTGISEFARLEEEAEAGVLEDLAELLSNRGRTEAEGGL